MRGWKQVALWNPTWPAQPDQCLTQPEAALWRLLAPACLQHLPLAMAGAYTITALFYHSEVS